ncbi:hypothetical protein AAFO92_21290 [Roseovarius sp. CAU 1744]|uniref:hypothetical protein n=1 Tax=Roseovarius sp. CAU 1744 TaxID=3140368 RepID=UPI00325A7404
MRLAKWVGGTVSAVIAVSFLGIAGWNFLDGTPSAAPIDGEQEAFDLSRLLVLVDGDMAATGYADGKLHPIAGARDMMVAIDGLGTDAPQITEVPASNTVMGWPGAMTAGSAGRYAYVVESRKNAPEGVAAMNNVFAEMPVGTLLTTIELSSGEVVATTEICTRPNNVDISPSEDWLLISCGTHEGELAVVPLVDGQPQTPRILDLDLPDIATRPGVNDGLTYAMIHPEGAAAGYIASDVGVGLIRFKLDADGVPMAAMAEPPLQEGDWLSVGRWTRAGDHFLVADVAWGAAPTDALFNGKGQILSFALSPDDDVRGVVSAAKVSKSPEAFELNRAGDRLVAVNMERTYLPGGVFGLVPGRGASSLSLVAIDDATGHLETLGDPVGFEGVLPEDAVFDTDGNQIAVVVFQDHDAPRSDGWIETFTLEGDQIRRTGERVKLPRGAHDLFALDRSNAVSRD